MTKSKTTETKIVFPEGLDEVRIRWFPGDGYMTPGEAALYAPGKDRHVVVRVQCVTRLIWYEVVGCRWYRRVKTRFTGLWLWKLIGDPIRGE